MRQRNVQGNFYGHQFQFTHPGGVRQARDATKLATQVSFNSRTREGCDFAQKAFDISSDLSFNSRTREGCDLLQLDGKVAVNAVSIHAPGRGATPRGIRVTRETQGVSIHAPGRGATVWCKVAYYGADKQA